ncbi:helix-turn-helix domain-containing protein [Ruminiclostridium cellulolyticum]|uniref:Transcriptional regulator, XRE family n=1 Tax=Ruminiclostridium cellulolyticum (strain ATCC 35319 / DSM 5812 / JCM 6584 / H10) TaxID=394503 RepID=B8I080_RUMCH|nr:helix-turn-helix transcriptional regulator [Ruminiclostridium cellulolyticum]ACL77406.1 transcriptional regulator, XRE family [Ruminiclostridium cellulolyticum H10]
MGLEVINELRKLKGLTSEQLSNQSGVPIGTLNKILSGVTKDPKLETLKALAKVLDCSLNDFDDSNNNNTCNSKTYSEAFKIFQMLNSDFQRYALNQIKSLLDLQNKL